MKMKKLPSEANSGKGNRPGEGRLGENREPMDKNRIEPERSGDASRRLPEGRAKPGNADRERRGGTTHRRRLVCPWR